MTHLPDTRQWSNLARRSFDYMLTLQSGMYRCLIITARGLYATPAGALYQIRRRYEYQRDGDLSDNSAFNGSGRKGQTCSNTPHLHSKKRLMRPQREKRRGVNRSKI
ncbi:hypothetical protein V8C43DRAFT_316175 [Trichoderma afarasin]